MTPALYTETMKHITPLIQNYCSEHFDFTFNPEKPCVKLHEPSFASDEICAALEILLSTQVTMGKLTKQLEKAYCETLGYQYGVMNNSGSSANLLAFAALTNPVTENHLNPGDEVIVPALSWATTVWPIIQMGLIPVFVDCDPKTFNIDIKALEQALSPKTKAIMLVHVYGNPCNMGQLCELAKQHNLQIIEDSCEAMGATYKGKSVGSFGRIGTFSFYFSHHITTLEGGICVTGDYELTETLRVLRAHGWSREAEQHQKYVDQNPFIDPRFIFINQGYNLRVTELQSAFGLKQLPKLAGFVETRRQVAAFYLKNLSRFSEFFDFQQETAESQSSWFGFSIILKDNCPFTVKAITQHLQSKGIETRPIIAGNLCNHPAMKLYNHRISGYLHNSDKIMRDGFAIGNHQHIDKAAQTYVIEQITQFIKENALLETI